MRLVRGDEEGARSAFVRGRFVRVVVFQAQIERDFRQVAGDFTFRHHSLNVLRRPPRLRILRAHRDGSEGL